MFCKKNNKLLGLKERIRDLDNPWNSNVTVSPGTMKKLCVGQKFEASLKKKEGNEEEREAAFWYWWWWWWCSGWMEEKVDLWLRFSTWVHEMRMKLPKLHSDHVSQAMLRELEPWSRPLREKGEWPNSTAAMVVVDGLRRSLCRSSTTFWGLLRRITHSFSTGHAG